MIGDDAVTPSESALVAGRERGAVDEELLAVLRREPLVCAVEQVAGAARPAVRELGGAPSVLAWTSHQRAAGAGWTGELVERSGGDVATLLRGTGLSLAINPGDAVGIGLQPSGVERLAGAQVVEAGSTVYLGEPAEPPVALVARLAQVLPGVPQVVEARVAQVLVDDGTAGSSRPLVVLSLATGTGAADRADALATCGRAVADSAPGAVDVAFADELGTLRSAVTALPAVYTREADAPGK